jgi:hypothetical protein
MPRVTKEVSHDLIQFAKSMKFYADVWDPKASSAFEFARQMMSPKLAKKNPNFECDMYYNEEKLPPRLEAKFSDGSTWTTETSEYKCSDLREIFYDRAMAVEDAAESAGADLITSGDIEPTYFQTKPTNLYPTNIPK